MFTCPTGIDNQSSDYFIQIYIRIRILHLWSVTDVLYVSQIWKKWLNITQKQKMDLSKSFKYKLMFSCL